jgi:hypothetical protein
VRIIPSPGGHRNPATHPPARIDLPPTSVSRVSGPGDHPCATNVRADGTAIERDLTSRLLVWMVTSTVAYRRWFLPFGRNHISRTRRIDHMSRLMLYGLRVAP